MWRSQPSFVRLGGVLLFACIGILMAFSATPEKEARKAKMEKLMAARTVSRTTASVTPIPDTNDLCGSAAVVTVGTYAGDNSFSGTDGTCSLGGVNDVWFRFTPTESRYYYVIADSYDFYPILSIHTGCPGSAGNEIGSTFYGMYVKLDSGVDYYIRLAGDNSYGDPTIGAYLLEISNAFALESSILQVAVNSEGDFTLALDGDPFDETNDLLFGHPDPWSSGITLYVDGSFYSNGLFDDTTAIWNRIQNPQTVDGVNTTVWRGGGVELKQELSLTAGTDGGGLDNLQMKYTATNTDTVNHLVGIRIFLDTWLGDNDGAPFRVPGIGDVVTETERDNSDIPFTWTAFDNLNNPKKIAYGTLITQEFPRPSRVIWGYWPDMTANAWNYTPDSNKSLTSDSAIAIYWLPVFLRPGQSITVGSYYGTTSFNIDMNPPLAVALTTPNELQPGTNDYVPNPFYITAYLEHSVPSVTAPLSDVYITLNLPAGLSLLQGETARQDLGTINVGESRSVWWLVSATPRFVANGQTPGPPDPFDVSAEVGATGQPTKTVNSTLLIPQLQLVVSAKNWEMYE